MAGIIDVESPTERMAKENILKFIGQNPGKTREEIVKGLQSATEIPERARGEDMVALCTSRLCVAGQIKCIPRSHTKADEGIRAEYWPVDSQ